MTAAVLLLAAALPHVQKLAPGVWVAAIARSSASAGLPHVQKLAPGVWAVGFSDQHGSANGGWFTTANDLARQKGLAS